MITDLGIDTSDDSGEDNGENIDSENGLDPKIRKAAESVAGLATSHIKRLIEVLNEPSLIPLQRQNLKTVLGDLIEAKMLASGLHYASLAEGIVDFNEAELDAIRRRRVELGLSNNGEG